MHDTATAARRPEMAGDLDHPHVRAVVNYQMAVARGDMESARAVFAPDVLYVVPGRNPLSGEYRGPDAVMGYVNRRWPGAEVTVRAARDSVEALRDLREGRVDAAVMRGPVDVPWAQWAVSWRSSRRPGSLRG